MRKNIIWVNEKYFNKMLLNVDKNSFSVVQFDAKFFISIVFLQLDLLRITRLDCTTWKYSQSMNTTITNPRSSISFSAEHSPFYAN